MEFRWANKTKYEDIDPTFEWKKDQEGHDTLELHVEGFKKEQLRVQLSSHVTILVYGERPPNEPMKLNGSRFHKEFKLSNEHSSSGISAKLSHGILRIKVPKSSISNHLDAQGAVADKKSSCGAIHRFLSVDRRRIMILLAVVASVVVVGFGAYFMYKKWVSKGDYMNNQTVPEVYPLHN